MQRAKTITQVFSNLDVIARVEAVEAAAADVHNLRRHGDALVVLRDLRQKLHVVLDKLRATPGRQPSLLQRFTIQNKSKTKN